MSSTSNTQQMACQSLARRRRSRSLYRGGRSRGGDLCAARVTGLPVRDVAVCTRVDEDVATFGTGVTGLPP